MYNLKPTPEVERIVNMGNPSQPLQAGARAKMAKQAPSQTSKSHPLSSMFRLLLYFAQRYPLICLFLVWGAFLYFGWLAVNGLAYTNPDPIESPKPEVVAEAPKPFRIDTPATSFGLLAIVAGSCAVTSVLLAKQLRPVKSSRRTVKRVVVQPKPVRPQTATAVRRPPMPIAKPNLPAPPERPVAATARPTTARKPPARPAVTVLLAEENSPFEMQDPSLAEMMDIRRQA